MKAAGSVTKMMIVTAIVLDILPSTLAYLIMYNLFDKKFVPLNALSSVELTQLFCPRTFVIRNSVNGIVVF